MSARKSTGFCAFSIIDASSRVVEVTGGPGPERGAAACWARCARRRAGRRRRRPRDCRRHCRRRRRAVHPCRDRRDASDPSHGGERVLHGGGVRIPRRQTVVDGDDDDARESRDTAGRPVAASRPPEGPAAAVEVTAAGTVPMRGTGDTPARSAPPGPSMLRSRASTRDAAHRRPSSARIGAGFSWSGCQRCPSRSSY